LGKPIEEVFERLMRAKQKDERANRDIDVLTKYRELRLNQAAFPRFFGLS